MKAPAAMSAMRAMPPMVPPTMAPTGVEDFWVSLRCGEAEVDDDAGAPTIEDGACVDDGEDVEDFDVVEVVEELVASLL